ncbi:MAG: hypothetical protein QOH26_1995 [Actinomycetota bacterium]|nr:hypothetical protein [Actinomycetota bacterium]
MVGGAYRGPVGLGRQRRTIRLVQVILVSIAAGLLMFAGYSLGRVNGYERGQRSDELGAPSKPAATQTIVLAILGLAALGGALAIQSEGGVRLLTPARLRDMEERGEGAPIPMEEPVTPEPRPEAATGSAPGTSE